MAEKELPSPEVLRQLLDYDPATGLLTWRKRGVEWFRPSKTRSAEHIRALWNARYANKEAFTADSGQGYRCGCLLGTKLKAHRVIWAMIFGHWPEEDIDHKNGGRADNRLNNIRDVPTRINTRNAAPHRKKSGMPPGVKFYPKKNSAPYQARICVDGKSRSLGYFDDPDAAHRAYIAAADQFGFGSRHGRAPAVYN